MKAVGRRLFAILIGYVAACIAASLLLHVMLFSWAMADRGWSAIGGWNGFVTIPFGALAVAANSLIVAAPMIFLAERLGWRSAFYFAAMGALTPLLTSAGLYLVAGEGGGLRPFILAWLLAAGIGGGLVYWGIAGRSSGRAMQGSEA